MKPKKSLGQHFLKCRWVVSTLIKAAEVSKNDTILEIGPGTGVLTRELAKYAGRVIAVEKDEHLAEELKKSLINEGAKNVKIVAGDIISLLKSDFNRVNALTTTYNLQTNSYKVVANIPYYLTSRLLRLLLENEPRPERIVLTIQKEVARRMVARPPHSNPVRSKMPGASADAQAHRTSNGMNLLALSIQAFGQPKIIKSVPADCFYPKPKVDSAIIAISDISDKMFRSPTSIYGSRTSKNQFQRGFFEILRIGFGQKRKMLLGVLGKKFGKNKMTDAFRAAGINPNARPEELSLEDWAKLAQESLEHRT